MRWSRALKKFGLQNGDSEARSVLEGKDIGILDCETIHQVVKLIRTTV